MHLLSRIALFSLLLTSTPTSTKSAPTLKVGFTDKVQKDKSQLLVCYFLAPKNELACTTIRDYVQHTMKEQKGSTIAM